MRQEEANVEIRLMSKVNMVARALARTYFAASEASVTGERNQ
jgi:hypothetical protein